MKKDYTDKEYTSKLLEMIEEKRYNHSVRVKDWAIKLAKIYGVDVKKAEIAGLYHDIGKYYSEDDAYLIFKKHNIDIDKYSFTNFHLAHGLIGRLILEDIGIEDEDILDSVEYHTTLKKDPTTLMKIVYLADKIESGRDYPGVEDIRKVSETDLDKGVLMSLDSTIVKLIDENKKIDQMTIEARNSLLGG